MEPDVSGSHKEVLAAVGGNVPDGMIAHIVRVIPEGFEITEFWDAKEQLDRFNNDVVGPAMSRAGLPMGGPPAESEEFETHVLQIIRPAME